jgi:hypothetical protein
MKKFLPVLFLFFLLAAGAAHAADWRSDLRAAIDGGNFDRVNIIAATHPGAQGDIALLLLKEAQAHASDRAMQIKIFDAATPFVGRIPAANIGPADDMISAMLAVGADPDFQQLHPQQANAILLSALVMSSQPNLVANDPTLHARALEAADDFVKKNPQDADKKLLDEVSLAEAGGAPSITPIGTINPSQE